MPPKNNNPALVPDLSEILARLDSELTASEIIRGLRWEAHIAPTSRDRISAWDKLAQTLGLYKQAMPQVNQFSDVITNPAVVEILREVCGREPHNKTG
jgi:hypothetical protein